MNDKVLKTLEYDKVLDMLMLRASCCVSRELVESMAHYDFSAVLADLELTQEAEGFYKKRVFAR